LSSSSFSLKAAQTQCLRLFLIRVSDLPDRPKPILKRRGAHKCPRATSVNRLSPSGSQEFPPGSCNGLFSAGFPTGALGDSHQTQRTSYPLPSSGRPFGHREAPLLISNFSRVSNSLLTVKPGPSCSCRRSLRLPYLSRSRLFCQA